MSGEANPELPRSHCQGIQVTECDALPGFDALIGMDIISHGDFAITNVGGVTCMSFRYPSIRTVDFVREAEELSYAGTKANEPCPCGNTDRRGKPLKYKRCHGRRGGKRM